MPEAVSLNSPLLGDIPEGRYELRVPLSHDGAIRLKMPTQDCCFGTLSVGVEGDSLQIFRPDDYPLQVVTRPGGGYVFNSPPERLMLTTPPYGASSRYKWTADCEPGRIANMVGFSSFIYVVGSYAIKKSKQSII